MNRKTILWASIAAGVASLAVSPVVLAQDQEAEEASVFEEVIVTATKREQSIYEVPVAITAFTDET